MRLGRNLPGPVATTQVVEVFWRPLGGDMSDDSQLETAALSEGERATLLAGVLERQRSGVSLLLYTRDGVIAAPLTEGDSLVVTRDALLCANAERPVREPARREPVESPAADGLVVANERMRAVFDTVERVASTSLPVLLIGETEAGKEVISRAIHEQSKRRDQSLLCVNCGAIPKDLVESTLFGHEKGAFTGVITRGDAVQIEDLPERVRELGSIAAPAPRAPWGELSGPGGPVNLKAEVN